MKVLLTGATGFLGRYVCDCLAQHGIETVVISNLRRPEAHGFSSITSDLLAETDFDSLVEQAGATHLLHLAWYAEHGKYWSSPLNLRWVEATIRLVEAFCEAGGQHVVAAGPCAEYDWSVDGPYSEDTAPLNAATLYGVTKDASHRLSRGICNQKNVRLSWGRVFMPYGPGDEDNRFIPSLIDVFAGRRAAFGINASAYRDFLYASDVAEGFLTLLQSGEDRAYNISSGQGDLLGDVVKELAKLSGGDPSDILRLRTERPGEPTHLIGDNANIRMLGWRAQVSLQAGLSQTVRELL